MRLIDADALKVAIERYMDSEETKVITGSGILSWEHREILRSIAVMRTACEIVDSAPTVDAVEVVRCKGCKYFIDLKCYAKNFRRCDPYVPEIHMTGKNDFCSCAERR